MLMLISRRDLCGVGCALRLPAQLGWRVGARFKPRRTLLTRSERRGERDPLKLPGERRLHSAKGGLPLCCRAPSANAAPLASPLRLRQRHARA